MQINTKPLALIGVMAAGSVAVGVATKHANDAASAHERAHPGGVSTSGVVLGASLLVGAAAYLSGAMMRNGSLGGVQSLGYAVSGALAVGTIAGAGMRERA